ncbi:uncharacterized protein LOC108599526 [Drosophila busckii]|uniref:uncharacterized protein LOC108599526 n=1 Tax=Drosophila busckii TaxID=30019 RepID=UPI001432B274|nr:uncharacterized protein LOC108599526 [Drosophila busckii]
MKSETGTYDEVKNESIGKVRRLYHQKYRDEWEKYPDYRDWLCRADDGYSAHCRICDTNVLPRLASIKQHLNTAKHQKAIGNTSFESKIKCEPYIKQEKEHGSHTQRKIKAKRPKTEKQYEIEAIEPDICSNDSILDDLLGNDDMNSQYIQEMSDQDMDVESRQEQLQDEELRIDNLEDKSVSEDHIISEFDLFGKSVSLQLNNMDLEDALLCQERLQVVLTEFRLRILKRNSKRNF